jgi:hypothetical protein
MFIPLYFALLFVMATNAWSTGGVATTDDTPMLA